MERGVGFVAGETHAKIKIAAGTIRPDKATTRAAGHLGRTFASQEAMKAVQTVGASTASTRIAQTTPDDGAIWRSYAVALQARRP
jgi:hypothetical protein